MVNDVTWLCLAAGQGTRLRPITNTKPKAMVPVADRPLIDWLTDTARDVGIEDRAVVTGYLSEMLEDRVGDVVTYENPMYAETDMVSSLWCAQEALNGTVVVSYGDILYKPKVLKTVLKSPHDIAVAVDEQWQAYWERRFEAPTKDAESLLIGQDDRITSIGQSVDSMEAPHAQYIGLIKFSPRGIQHLREVYEAAGRGDHVAGQPFEDQQSFQSLHMTDLIQGLIDRGTPVHAARIQGGWVEIDTLRDLELARSVCHPTGDGTLNIDRSARNNIKE
jgi:Predicted sugar nucleotidyltransferases